MKISVIVPVYNGGQTFQACIDSIVKLSDIDELIVVDDASTDQVVQYAIAHGADVIHLPENGGPANARNIGAEKASGDILFFVDADVTLHTDTILELRSAFGDHDVHAMIGSYDDEPAASNFLSQYRNLLHHFVHQHASTTATTFWGACGAIRREAFFSVNGFDAYRYRLPSIEDIELGYRLHAAGYHILLNKNLYVKHHKQWHPLNMIETDLFRRAIPWTILLCERPTVEKDLNISASGRLSVLFVGLTILLIPFIAFAVEVIVLMVIATAIVLWLNRELYRFFFKKRGLWFMVRAIFWHWIYFVYSGIGYIAGNLLFQVARYRHKIKKQELHS